MLLCITISNIHDKIMNSLGLETTFVHRSPFRGLELSLISLSVLETTMLNSPFSMRKSRHFRGIVWGILSQLSVSTGQRYISRR